MAGPLAAAAVLGQAVGAIQNVVNEIRRLPDAVRGFVDAFNPQAGERLDYAFRSLHATIGFGLEPVITTTTRIVEKFADAISNGMDRLRAPIEKVSGLLLGALAPGFASVATIFDGLATAAEALTPLMEPAAAVLEAVMALGHVLTTIGVESLLEGIRMLIPETRTLADVTHAVTGALVSLTGTVLHFADFLLSFVGKQHVLLNVLDSLARPRAEGNRRAPAPSNFGMSSLEDIYKQRLVAAAKGAGGKTPEEQSRDYLADIRKIAEQIRDQLKNDPVGGANAARAAARDVAWWMAPVSAPLAIALRILAWDRADERNRAGQGGPARP
jgi:hypothetical protein